MSLDLQLQRAWYGEGRLTWLLLPLSWCFWLALKIRRTLFDVGLRKSRRVGCPVVVVGNLTVGGTGKTPVVVWLARQLIEKGYSVGIASRGYRSSTERGVSWVEEDSDPAEVGDEPVLVRRRSGTRVAVGADRVAVGKMLAQAGVEIVICDDGLQHYQLYRDVEICVIDGERRFGNGRLLPAGPLRESRDRLAEVDAVICNGSSGSPQEIQMSLSGDSVVNLVDGSRRHLSELEGERWHAIAGIGNPGRFFDRLQEAGIRIERHSLPDHALLTAGDLEFEDGRPVLMTEKDAVKCSGFATGQHWYLPVQADFGDNGEMLVRMVIERCGLMEKGTK